MEFTNQIIMKNNTDYQFEIESNQKIEELFKTLLNVRLWWNGLYDESYDGPSDVLGQEFTFKAGGGAHYSKQKLIECIPNQKITWLVTDSHLSFLEQSDEWTNSKLHFEIEAKENLVLVRFTHEGLKPSTECYSACSDAWGRYMTQKLKPLIAAE
jgi:hypothetical protein